MVTMFYLPRVDPDVWEAFLKAGSSYRTGWTRRVVVLTFQGAACCGSLREMDRELTY